MLEFLFDISVVFGGKVSQQIVSFSIGNVLLSQPFLYLNEAEFIQSLLVDDKKQFASVFNFKYRYSKSINI